MPAEYINLDTRKLSSMAPLVVLLMPWGRVGSNLVNNVVTQSKMLRVWNEPLTGVQTRVISRGGTLEDVGEEQRAWLEEHVVPATEGIFLNIAANSLRSPDDVRDTIAPRAPSYICLLYTSPSPRDKRQSRMPSSA